MSKLDRMLYRMINNSRGQFVAVVTIIIVGIAIFVAMGMTSVNMKNTVDDYYEDYHFADMFVQLEAIPAQKALELTNMPGIKQVTGRIVAEAPLLTDDEKERVNVRLITAPQEDSLNNCLLLSGKPIEDGSRQTWVINKFAEARDIKIGDKLEIQKNGQNYTLDVVGIVANPEFIYLMASAQELLPDPTNYGVLYISEALAEQMTGLKEAYNDLLITHTNDVQEEELIKSLQNRFSHYGLKDITKREYQMSNNIIQEELKQLNRMSGSLPIVFILIAGLILIMMLGRMVKRDRIKIGVLKAMGYKNREVLFHYVKYAVASGILGGFIGAVTGLLLSGAMTRLYLQFFNIPLLRVDFNIPLVFMSILISGVFCALSGVIGARGILKIMPADSMRSESPKAGKQIFLEHIPFIWRKLKFSSKMVWKNIFRNKKRSAFVLFGASITYAMMLFSMSMPGAMDDMMNKHYQEFQKMDYIIGFYTPVRTASINDLEHVLNIDYMEGKLEYGFELENGNITQGVSIIGLSPETQFYSFKDLQGNSIKIPSKGILLSENLAGILNVKKGDSVRIKTFISGKENVYVEVKDIIKQSLGLNAYMDIDYMGKELMERNMVNGVYLNAKDEVNQKLLPVSNIASVMSIENTRAMYLEYMTMMIVMVGFMIVFSGVLGFCIVYNATTITIGEREMEFSSLRVLGFAKEEIFRMIRNENIIITIIGVLVGVPLGIGLLKSMTSAFTTNMYTISLDPNLTAYIFSAIFTVVFVLISQGATYIKIKKLDLLQALKSRTS